MQQKWSQIKEITKNWNPQKVRKYPAKVRKFPQKYANWDFLIVAIWEVGQKSILLMDFQQRIWASKKTSDTLPGYRLTNEHLRRSLPLSMFRLCLYGSRRKYRATNMHPGKTLDLGVHLVQQQQAMSNPDPVSIEAALTVGTSFWVASRT